MRRKSVEACQMDGVAAYNEGAGSEMDGRKREEFLIFVRQSAATD